LKFDNRWLVKANSKILLFTNKTVFAGKIIGVGDKKIQLVNLVLSGIVEEIKPEIAEKIVSGIKQYDDSGKIIAEVIGVKIKPQEVAIIDDSGNVYKREDPIYKNVEVVLKIKAEKIDNDLFFNNNEIKIGKIIIINTDKIPFPLKIINF